MIILYYSDDDSIKDENLFKDDDLEVNSEVPDSQGLDEQENDASAGVCIIYFLSPVLLYSRWWRR